MIDVRDGGDHAVVDGCGVAGVEVELAAHVLREHDPVTDLEWLAVDVDRGAMDHPGCDCSVAGEVVEEVRFGVRSGQHVRVRSASVCREPVGDGVCLDVGLVFAEHDALVVEVRLPERRDVAVAEVVERRVFPFVTLPSVDRQLASTVSDSAEEGLEAAASLDLGELVMVADDDHFRPGGACSGDESVELEGADHAGFVQYQHVIRFDGAVCEELVDRERIDPRAVGQFACRTCSRAGADHPIVRCLEDFADGVHRVRLAGSGFADDHLDPETLGGEAAHGVGLVRSQRSASSRQRGEYLVDELRVQGGDRRGRVGGEQGDQIGLRVRARCGSSRSVPSPCRHRL